VQSRMEDAFARDASEVSTAAVPAGLFFLAWEPVVGFTCCLLIYYLYLLQVLRLLNVDPGAGLSDAEVLEVCSPVFIYDCTLCQGLSLTSPAGQSQVWQQRAASRARYECKLFSTVLAHFKMWFQQGTQASLSRHHHVLCRNYILEIGTQAIR